MGRRPHASSRTERRGWAGAHATKVSARITRSSEEPPRVPRPYCGRASARVAAASAWSRGGRAIDSPLSGREDYSISGGAPSGAEPASEDADGARVLRVRISNPSLLPDLAEFLGRVPCETRALRETVLEVRVTYACTPPKARADLDLYLAAWRGLHPNVEIALLEP